MARVVRSPLPVVHAPDNISFPKLILSTFCRWPNKAALIDGITGRQYTYADIEKLVYQLASALHRNGLRKGDVLCAYAPNSVEYALILLAAPLIGAIVTGINPISLADELVHHIVDSKSVWLFVTPELLEVAKTRAKALSGIQRVIVTQESNDKFATSFWELLSHGDAADVPDVPINPRTDVAILPYSSGTTGTPKGTLISHYNIVVQVANFGPHGSRIYETGKDTCIVVFPFYHIGGLFNNLLLGLYEGVTFIVFPQFDWDRYLTITERYKCTLMIAPPPLVVRLAKDPSVKRYDLSHVTTLFTGAAPSPEHIIAEALEAVGIKYMRQAYGMTENSGGTHITPRGSTKLASVGTPLPSCECKVIDTETGKMLGPNEDGELVVRGPFVMMGYLNNPEATNATIDKYGWQKTGDIGHYDEEGYFYIVDRLKELIKYKGFQVAPAELEAKLLTHPGVADAAVIGVPDERSGELPRAYVTLKPTHKHVSRQEIVDFIKKVVAPYKQLRGGVEIRDNIPKSPSGKILRRVLRDELRRAQSKL